MPGSGNIIEVAIENQITVYLDHSNEEGDGAGAKCVWLIFDHGLLYPGVKPMKLVKGIKFNRQVDMGVPIMPYHPFSSREAWLAVKLLLNAAGVFELGLFCDAICVITNSRFRARQMTMFGLLLSLTEAMKDYLGDGKTLEFRRNEYFIACEGCERCQLGTE